MRRIALAVIGAMLAGCGAAAPRVVPRPVSASGDEEVAPVGEASLRIIPRESGGRAWVSLWIDAGSRDADPPALATVAAWAVAREHGLEARVIPDGTELRASCDSERVEACVDALAAALASRSAAVALLDAALERLRATRRGARNDRARTADRLAIEALLGAPPGLDVLGEAEDDPRITVAAVEAFLAAHYGPSRALVVAIGDADETRVRARVAAAIASAPSATQARAERSLEPRVAAGVEVDEAGAASAAVLAASAPEAIAIARRATADLEGATASVFPLRGGEVVVVRGRDARELAAALSYARAVGGEEQALGDDDPRSLAGRVGARWVARGRERAAGGLGVGAIVAGGRGDSDAEDPDAALREGERSALEARATELEALARGEGIEAERGADSLVLRDAEGTRVVARRVALGRVAIALSIAGGTPDEPARLQGRSALLARLLASCVGLDAEAWVDPSSLGVVIEVEPASALAQVEQVTRCARQRTWTPEAIEEARARALASLDDDALRLSWAGRALAPGAPASIAPRGTALTLAAIERRSLRRAWHELATRGRVALAIVGDVDPEASARIAMLGLAALPAPSPRRAGPTAGIAPEELIAVASDAAQAEVVVAFRDPAPRPSSDVGARAALDALVRSIDGPALRVVWARSGSGDEGAWAVFAVRGDEGALASVPERLQGARAQARAALPASLVPALAAAREARARDGSTARGLARVLAADEDPPIDEESSARTARALLEVAPRFVVVRPSAAERRVDPR